MDDKHEQTLLSGDEIRAAALALTHGRTISLRGLTRAEVAEILKHASVVLWWKRRNLPQPPEGSDYLDDSAATVFLDKLGVKPTDILRELLQEPLVLGLLAALATACGLRLTLTTPAGFGL